MVLIERTTRRIRVVDERLAIMGRKPNLIPGEPVEGGQLTRKMIEETTDEAELRS